MLNALSISLVGATPGGRARAKQSLERQGFELVERFQWDGGVVHAWGHPAQISTEHVFARTPTGFACSAGPFWYQGKFGSEALESLLGAVGETSRLDETRLRGNFAAFVHNGHRAILLNDALGFVRIYASADRSFYSTSWLATCAYSGFVELDEAAAVEYVLLGASHSTATVAQGVNTLPLGHVFDLSARRTSLRLPPETWSRADVPVSFDDGIAAMDGALRATFDEVAATFPGRVRAALSGGFDSRLILAGSLASGVAPDLFVYGHSGAADVGVAQAVAKHLGLGLTVVDKQDRARGLPPADLDRAVRNVLFFDGLPNDGIHDCGVDEQTRLEQLANGWLALNGGGGEIFRNYFHLPDRTFRAMDIVHSFYRGFDHRVFRRPGGLRDYMHRLASAMERVLGVPQSRAGARLGREQIELLYPLFRCHHWMAVNNSVGIRHGFYATPLVDINTVRLACRLPLAWKAAGKFESRLIAGLHQGTAQPSSEYGFNFVAGPDRRALWNEWATCARPVRARPLINAAHRALGRSGLPRDVAASWRRAIPGEWLMDGILDVDRLPSVDAFGRMLAIEVAWRHVLPAGLAQG